MRSLQLRGMGKAWMREISERSDRKCDARRKSESICIDSDTFFFDTEKSSSSLNYLSVPQQPNT